VSATFPISKPLDKSRPHAAMRRSGLVSGLALFVALLAFAAAAAGLLTQGGDGPLAFTTLRGQTVQILGQGLYRYDTIFNGSGFKGQDLITLLLIAPLLLVSLTFYRRGSLRGGLLLLGALGSVLYVYASMALNAAYNPLFLLYVVLFSASFYAFMLHFTNFDLSPFVARLPRRGPAIFMFASGLITTVVWAGPLVGALFTGEPPSDLGSYSTFVTYALDLAIITPATIIAGVLIWRREQLGYLMALSMLVLEAMLAPMMAAQTYFQLEAGVEFTTGMIAGPLMGFGILALCAAWVLMAILRAVR
jgi:hypothetical protein